MSRHRFLQVCVVWHVALAVLLLSPQPGGAASILGTPSPLGMPFNTTADDWSMTFTADGLMAVFSSTRPGGYGSDDLWMVTRSTVSSPWSEAVNLGSPVNTSASEGYPSLSPDGLTLYFSEMFGSTTARPLRPGGTGGQDLWITTRPDRQSPWAVPVNLGSGVNSASDERAPCISADGLSLYFASNRPGGSGTLDLWVSTRPDPESPWTAPVNLGPSVNSGDDDSDPSLSPDGLTLFFASWGRPGGNGSHDLYVATRVSTADPWAPAVNLGPTVNSPSADGCPCFWAGGSTLVFVSYRGGSAAGFDYWQLPIIPVIDFNGDGNVDGREVKVIAQSWGQDAPVADVAPLPFGDGIVDTSDLLLLADYIGAPVDDPTLAAHWAFDEAEGTTVAEGVGQADGTVLGSAVWRPQDGVVDGTLDLDGQDDCIVTDFVLNPADGPFSVLAWIRGGAPGQVVVSQVDGSNWLMLDASTGGLRTELTQGGRTDLPLNSDVAISDGLWHRVGLTWDGATRRLYVDGTLVAQDDQIRLVGSFGGMNLGCGSDAAAGTFFTGLIDEVRIYRRVVWP